MEGDLDRYVQMTSLPWFGKDILLASPAQYGTDLTMHGPVGVCLIYEKLFLAIQGLEIGQSRKGFVV